MDPVEYLGDYIRGRFVKAKDPDGVIVSISARDKTDEVGRFPFRLAAVDEAVQAARRAQGEWAALTLADRIKSLKKIKAALVNREDDLARLITRELGKPLWDARGEARACIAKVDVTIEAGLKLVETVHPEGVSGRYAFKPHGVLGIIGPFNFPVHLSNGHILPALATGNTVILKPSEVTPAAAQLYAEILDDADLPKGVFNLVQGDGTVGSALAGHPGIHGVLFTGSYAVGQKIRKLTFDQPWKTLALEMGGKNPAIVLDDCDLEKAVHDVLWASYVSAGQRCTATSWAIVHKKKVDAFVARLKEKAERVVVGDPLDDGVFMGPLATEAARERFLSGVRDGEAEGAEAILAPRALEHDPDGWYVTPGIHRVHEVRDQSPYQTEELFGPDVAVYSVRDVEEAVALANSVDYGFATSVFTADDKRFEWAFRHLDYGIINKNAPTCGASSKLPFAGIKKSGNFRPAALFSTLYCTYPVATLEGPAHLDPGKVSPGLPW